MQSFVLKKTGRNAFLLIVWLIDLSLMQHSDKPSFGIKKYCQDFLKTRSEKLALKTCGHSYFLG